MFNKIKNYVTTQIAQAREINEIKSRWLIHTTHHVINDVHVEISNDIVFATTGFKTASACINDRGIILVNEAFLELDEDVQMAIIAHEQGHKELNHVAVVSNQLIYLAQQVFCRGKGFEIELEADRHSYDKGYNMIKALKVMLSFNESNRALRKRLEILMQYDALLNA